MDVMEASYRRRAVRSYASQPVVRALIDKLLHAAVQAPSAMNQQPWAFAVIQDRSLLRRYSDRARAVFLAQSAGDPHMGRLRETLASADYNVFHNAGTLIVICAGAGALSTAEDCCLAGENLMLAACACGLGTCPIGLARPMLNLPEIKAELNIPTEFSPVLPIIVGFPAGPTPPVPRAEPRIFAWE